MPTEFMYTRLRAGCIGGCRGRVIRCPRVVVPGRTG